MQWDSFVEFITRELHLSTLHDKINKNRNEYELMSIIMSNVDIGLIIKSWLEKQSKLKVSKCSEKAKLFKNKGNKCFKEKNYKTSIEFYTNSAKNGNFDNGDYAISLANRSAALLHMDEYKKCLEDIDVALSSNYPESLHPKLHLRSAQCWIKLCNVIQANEQLTKVQNLITNENILTNDRKQLIDQIVKLKAEIGKISGKNLSPIVDNVELCPENLKSSNPIYSSESSTLMRKYSPTKGRYVVTKNPVNRGDILYIEKPFALVTLDHVTTNPICVHCCRYISNNISYPCRGCSHAIYCSKLCWNDSWLSYHKWECIGYDMNIWKQIGIAHLALKVLFSSIETHDKIEFNDIQKLITNIEDVTADDLISYSITARMLVQYLEIYTDIFNVVDMKKCLVDKFMDEEFFISRNNLHHDYQKLLVGALLLRHMLQLVANGHAITQLNLTGCEGENIFEEQQQKIGVGIYPSVSMMNHSCDPNIISTFWNSYIIVKATRNVPAGGEIFNCYGPHFRRMGLKERQDVLKNQYLFTCQCEPCTDPELQHFLDRFSALKCLSCNGPSTKIHSNSLKCLDCNLICTDNNKKRTDDLNNANNLFNSAQDFMHSGNNDKAFTDYERCLNIRQKWLFKYHDDVIIAYDALAKICIILSRWYDSILYLEQTILAVEEKFDLDSIEVANELNKITDICIEYLKQASNRNSPEYRNIFAKTKYFLERAEKIMGMIRGSWTDSYQQIFYKKMIFNMLESHSI